jgi:hypothetical protein
VFIEQLAAVVKADPVAVKQLVDVGLEKQAISATKALTVVADRL